MTNNTFDIVCTVCGARDSVSFKPRAGSDVKCRTCFSKARKSRGRGGKAPRQQARQVKTWTIACSSCGNEDSVPFEPREGSEVLCGECHKARRDKRDRAQKYGGKGARGNHVPRLDHGTRVFYPIECDTCGKKENLTHVPKTTGPSLCTSCHEAKFGKGWAHVKRASEREDTENLKTFGKKRRVVEMAKPNPERLEDFEDLNDSVKVRRS